MDPRILNEDQRERLRMRFTQIDSDHDGQITLSDIKSIHPDMAENPLLEPTFNLLKGPSTNLTFPSLISAITRLSTPSEKLRIVFDIYDTDKDGFISPQDLFKSVQLMCKDNLTPTQLSELVRRTFREFDTDNDGLISFSEFENHCNIRLDSQLCIEW